jgi:glutamine amidotransferase
MLKRIGVESTISADPAGIEAATKLILPGVGAFDAGMAHLHERGLVAPLKLRADAGVPVLGLCLGMQLLASQSEEGKQQGLGWIDADVVRFKFADRQLPVPHMGWNSLTLQGDSRLVDLSDPETRFYFVHSYHLSCGDASDVVATANYGYDFPAVIERGNVMGTQFHPEKSHKFGMQLLKRFVERT